MSSEFLWQLPAHGDARFGDAKARLRGERNAKEAPPLQAGVSDPRGNTFNYLDYLHQVARGAELSGFDGIRIQHDPKGDEAWIIAGYVARGTRRLKLLTEFEASWGSAVYAAKNAVSVQRYTGGRMAWQLSTGQDASERSRNADPIPDADVLSRIDEFVTVARGVIGTAPFSFKGRFYEVLEGGFRGTLANHPPPPVYLSGETPDAYELSARLADVHVLSAAEPAELRARIAALRDHEARLDKPRAIGPLELGIRLDLLARESAEEAGFDAERLAKQSGVTEPDRGLGLWTGLTRSRSDDTKTLVGSYAEVVERLGAYSELGVTHFLLGASPHLEEAYRIGTHVLPAARQLIESQARAA